MNKTFLDAIWLKMVKWQIKIKAIYNCKGDIGGVGNINFVERKGKEERKKERKKEE